MKNSISAWSAPHSLSKLLAVATVTSLLISPVAGAEARIVAPLTGFGVATPAVTPTPLIETVDATGVYSLGDSDSKHDARKQALELARQSAAEKVGVFIQSDTSIQDDQLKLEDYRVVTAALLEVDVLDESLTLSPDGTLTMRVSIRARVDRGALSAYIKNAASNAKQLREINFLKEQNAKLFTELAEANQALVQNDGSDIPTLQRLERRRYDLLERIDGVHESAKLSFDKGSLAAAARESGDAYSDMVADIETNFWDRLAGSLTVSIGDIQVRDNRDGSADVHVPLRWESDRDAVYTVLERYFYVTPDEHPQLWSGNEFIAVQQRLNRHGHVKSLHSETLLKEMTRQSLSVRLRLGRHEQRILVAGGASSTTTHGNCAVHGGSNPSLCVRTQLSDDDSPIGFLADGKGLTELGGITFINPVIFRNIPVKDLQTIGSVNADVVRSHEE